MSIIADDVAPFIRTTREDDGEERREPLGDRLRGRFATLDIDSVETVRELRERR